MSAAETDERSTHQTIGIGVAAIAPYRAMAGRLRDEISQYIEETTDAEILDETTDTR